MKADLFTAQVQASGSHGLAHRTAAGFVVLTSADGGELISLIVAQQNESNLIDQVVAAAADNGPAAFAMLFTAGGELFLLASGSAEVTVQSASTRLTLAPTPGQVLVQPISAGINETAAAMFMHNGGGKSSDSYLNLQAGTSHADWVEVAIGGGVVIAAPPVSQERELVLADEVKSITATPAQPDESLPEESLPGESAADAQQPAISDIPIVERISSPSPSSPPPAAQEIVFIEDIEEISDLIEPPASDEAASADTDVAPTEIPVVPTTGVGPVMVLGVACPQGHHNHPDAVYCSQCGTKMAVHHTTVLLNGPRPPLGVLVVDDGTTYSLSEDLVIGREPASHEDVRTGSASPMILTDETLAMSRQHARIILDDWSAYVADLNSSNGTFVNRSGVDTTWTQVGPGSTLALEPGDRIRIGGRIMQVELHHPR